MSSLSSVVSDASSSLYLGLSFPAFNEFNVGATLLLPLLVLLLLTLPELVVSQSSLFLVEKMHHSVSCTKQG